MTQYEKDILLKDLSARLPYGVKIDNMGEPSLLVSINNKYNIIVEIAEVDKKSSFNLPSIDVLKIEDAKPYLFPLSSMTDEQKREYHELIGGFFGASALISIEGLTDFFNKNHIDYRGLIPMELANDATDKNIY